MNNQDTKRTIEKALIGFEKAPLKEAAIALFESLGYRSQKRLDLNPNTGANFLNTFAQDRPFNREQAMVDDWKSVDFLFQLTDAEIQASGQGQLPFESTRKYDGAIIQSYLFFAIKLGKDRYTRTQLSAITRSVNRLFDMPVMILFLHGDMLTLSIIRRRLHKRDESKDVLEKVTLVKDIRLAKPHRAHIEILTDLSIGELFKTYHFTNFVQLHEAWQQVLDSSILNRRFYQELANWYFWALDNVLFPDGARKDKDGRDSLSLIRLITRVIFCWFLREKGLIPDELFRLRDVKALLVSLEDGENSYYTAILQNLFFATLNTEMDETGKPMNRRFIEANRAAKVSEDHMIHSLWRYQELIRDRVRFERIFRGIPFLNGGLFECLDERLEQGKSAFTSEIRVDGFSVIPAKQPRVPNFLFFGAERRADLSRAYGEIRYRETKVLPLIPLLERYKFTVTENTPIEEEVALDPELLGLVFENLLASYNPETDKVARKTTGSFYTPRQVVEFMVDEALIAYLENSLKSRAQNSKHPFESRVRSLLRYSDAPLDFTLDEVRLLIAAIDGLKILDPACGSAAFPLGALHKLVYLLRRLDPGNASWKQRQLTKARLLDVGRQEAIAAIEQTFARDAGDFARKLYLIENCLYGVDIQAIAVQIAKLRCFISLVVEQQPDDSLPNRGILPLPNLETNFVTADTLIGLHPSGQMLLTAEALQEKKAELRRVRHEHFMSRRYSEKKALRKRDKELRKELAELLIASRVFRAVEAERVATWDPYHPDRAAEFFDPEWMFNFGSERNQQHVYAPAETLHAVGEAESQSEFASALRSSGGFDIIIGNPPYIRQEQLKHVKVFEGTTEERPLKEALKDDYYCYSGLADIYVYFYEKSFDLLRVGGLLCFISSNKYFRSGYGERLRHFLATNGEVRLLIDFGDAPVFTSIAYPSILLVRKLRETHEKSSIEGISRAKRKLLQTVLDNKTRVLTWQAGLPIEGFPEIFAERSFELLQKELTPEGWRLESPRTLQLLEKIRKAGPPLGEYVKGRLYRGILTGLNKALVVDRATRDRLISEHKSSAQLLKPWLRGRDVKRWYPEFGDQYLIRIESSDNKQHPWTGKRLQEAEQIFASMYPAVHKWFIPHKAAMKARYDQGKYYWELRSCDYYNEFLEPKVIIPAIANDVAYCVDRDAHLSNDKTSICIPRDPEFVAGLLNSKPLWWVIQKQAATKQGGFYEFKPMYVSKLPIPLGDEPLAEGIRKHVVEIIALARERGRHSVLDLENNIDGFAAHLYKLTEDELKFILEDLDLPDPMRVGALNAYRDIARERMK